MTMTSRELWANMSQPNKTGERNKGTNNAPRLVKEVESVPCPKRRGLHELVKTNSGVYCIHCGVPWAELDMQINGPRRKKEQ